MVESVSGLTSPTLTLQALRSSLADESRHTAQRKQSSAVALATSQTVLGNAIEAGKTISEFLTTLRSTIFHASMEGVVANTKNARFSRQGEVAVILRQIDQAVDLATHKGINVISSNASAVRLQTTSTGGSLLVTPRPLDAVGLQLSDLAIKPLDLVGLGLSNLGIISDENVAEALEKVDRAIQVAGSRLNDLVGFKSIVGGASSFLTQINPRNLRVDATSLPPGTFLDIVT